MRIAYLTTDEVNRHLAEGMAAACGVTLYPLAPKDPPPGGAFDALLYDWDHWPAVRRQKATVEMLAGRLPHAVAVHGYNLEDGEAEAFRRHTVAVYRCLRPRVFGFLRRAARSVQAARALTRGPQAGHVTRLHPSPVRRCPTEPDRPNVLTRIGTE